MTLSRGRRSGRVPWEWLVPLLATLPLVWLGGGGANLGDSGLFSRVGQTLLSARWAQTYHQAGIQAGPLELALYGAGGRLGPLVGIGLGRLLAPPVEFGTIALLLLVLRAVLPSGGPRTLALGVIGTLAVLTRVPAIVFSAGHPADALIPLLWVLAANDARRGRAVRSGLILALSANIELWGVLGSPVLLLLPTLRQAGRAWVTQLVLTLGPLAPFVAAGGFRMFDYAWTVHDGAPISLLLRAGTPFPWTLRLAQGGCALAAGVLAARLARRSRSSVWLVPLVIVAVRLLLDPAPNGYYLAGWIVLALTAAGFGICWLAPRLGDRRANTSGVRQHA